VLLLLKALLLGIVEGATEFLPISSTGHLIIASALIDYPEAKRATFEIFIQLGAILAVFWHFRAPLADLAARAPREAAARNFVLKVGLAFVPAAIVGFLLHDAIEQHLFRPRVVGAALVGGGLIILLVESRARRVRVAEMRDVGWLDALWVGLAQITSLFPGVSRAGATIIGGLIVGLGRPAATQFSFYLALPTITAASLFSLVKSLPCSRPKTCCRSQSASSPPSSPHWSSFGDSCRTCRRTISRCSATIESGSGCWCTSWPDARPAPGWQPGQGRASPLDRVREAALDQRLVLG